MRGGARLNRSTLTQTLRSAMADDKLPSDYDAIVVGTGEYSCNQCNTKQPVTSCLSYRNKPLVEKV